MYLIIYFGGMKRFNGKIMHCIHMSFDCLEEDVEWITFNKKYEFDNCMEYTISCACAPLATTTIITT